MNVVAGGLFSAGLMLAASSPFLMLGAVALSFAASRMQSSVSGLARSTIIINTFLDAAKKLSIFSFSYMFANFADLSLVVSRVTNDINVLEKLSIRFSNISFDATKLSESISTVAEELNSAVDALEIPINLLSKQIERIVEEIDKIAEQEVLNRIKNQWSDDMRLEKSDYSIENNDLRKAFQQVDEILKKIDNY
jgi:hypothetical protein